MAETRIEKCVTCGEQTANIHFPTFSVCKPCMLKDALGYCLVPSSRPEVLAVQS